MKRDFNVGTIVDRLGAVKAVISSLKDEEAAFKATLIGVAAHGTERSFEGAQYRATVSFTDKTVTDWEEVMHRLFVAGVDPVTLMKARNASTRTAEGVPVVRVSARKAS